MAPNKYVASKAFYTQGAAALSLALKPMHMFVNKTGRSKGASCLKPIFLWEQD
jgi:hypothetical protein